MTAADSKTGAMDATPSLSLCMIVKNEEFFLRRCLSSVKDYVDEIIIVETGSTDQTKAIALEFTDKVYDYAWQDDFSHARNFALEQASGDWILVLDADELVAETDLRAIRKAIIDSHYDAFYLIQYNYNNEHLIKGWLPVKEPTQYSGEYLGYRRNPIGRLFRNVPDIRFQGRVHEVIDQSIESRNSTTLEIPIHHHMDDNPSKSKKDRQLNYLRIIEKSLENAPDGRLYASAAVVCMYYTLDYPKAIEYFQHAVSLGYDVDANKENLAEAYYRDNQLEESRALYTGLFESGYATVTLCTNLANLLVKGGNFSRAAHLLRTALSLGELGDESRARIEHNIQYLDSQIDTFGSN
jgi:glycosyltransferase involved in cell wall biosynthesis